MPHAAGGSWQKPKTLLPSRVDYERVDYENKILICIWESVNMRYLACMKAEYSGEFPLYTPCACGIKYDRVV